MAKTWLLKTEPSVYGWPQMLKDGVTRWDGIRNAQARNNLSKMAVGDRAFFYHTDDERSVVGIVEVVKAAYPDPEDDEDGKWLVVDVKPVAALKQPVTLAQVKAEESLAQIPLVRQARLSAMELDAAAWKKILALGGGEKKL
jgi:predicted RNA-binding protein with PUA-like domain